MKRTDKSVSKALRDVWVWKDAVYRDVRKLPVDEALSAILDRAEETAPAKKSRGGAGRRRKSTAA